MHSTRAKPLLANGGDASCELHPTACVTAGLWFQTHRSAAGVDRSRCFGRDSQTKGYVLLREAMAEGNSMHWSALDLAAANCW